MWAYTTGEITSQRLWSRYDRHFVCITRYNGEDLSCYSNKTESVYENVHNITDLQTWLI